MQEATLALGMAEEAAVNTDSMALHGDVLTLVLEHLDGFEVGSVSSVAKEWRDSCHSDHLWRDLVLQRWKLGDRKRRGKYKFGERSWRECWRVFHRRNKLPVIDSVSDREVVYASGRAHRIACWLHIAHQPACKLAILGEPLAPHLCARLIVQNLRSSPIVSDTVFSLSLTLRDGTPAEKATPAPRIRHEAACHTDHRLSCPAPFSYFKPTEPPPCLIR